MKIKLRSIFFTLSALLTCWITAHAQVIDSTEWYEQEYERQYEERQKQLTQQCTDKMVQLLRDAPIVVEGKILYKIDYIDHLKKDGKKQKFWRWKVVVSQYLKGNPTVYNDTLMYIMPGAYLDGNNNEITYDHGFSNGQYYDKPIILMLKPNDDTNSPFYHDARQNYIAYDAVHPSIGYDFIISAKNEDDPKILFQYQFSEYCHAILPISEFNKMISQIPKMKSLQKKKPRKCWVKRRTGNK